MSAKCQKRTHAVQQTTRPQAANWMADQAPSCGRPELVLAALRAAGPVVEVRPLVAAVHHRGEPPGWAPTLGAPSWELSQEEGPQGEGAWLSQFRRLTLITLRLQVTLTQGIEAQRRTAMRTTTLAAACGLVALFVIAQSFSSQAGQRLKSQTAPPPPWTGCCTTCSHGLCSGCSEMHGTYCTGSRVKADC